MTTKDTKAKIDTETKIEAVEPVTAEARKRIVRKRLKPVGPLEVDNKNLDTEHFVYRHTLERNVRQREDLGYTIAQVDGETDRRHANFSKEASSTHSVLMRIPKEDYEEIQQFKKEEIDEQMASIEPVKGSDPNFGLKTRIEK